MKNRTIDSDWYTYLTEDFKLDRSMYKSKDKAVLDCPSCGGTDFIRVDHAKAKIARDGAYACSLCKKRLGAIKSRARIVRKT